MGESDMVNPLSLDRSVPRTEADEQIDRVTEAFCNEMTVRYWQPGIMTIEEFRKYLLYDLQRLVTIVQSVR
jgi:hypothetical protein